jgi:hypothetical protein
MLMPLHLLLFLSSSSSAPLPIRCRICVDLFSSDEVVDNTKPGPFSFFLFFDECYGLDCGHLFCRSCYGIDLSNIKLMTVPVTFSIFFLIRDLDPCRYHSLLL